MSRRSVATALAVVLVAGVVAAAYAGPADYVMPVDKHTSVKGRALAVKYQPQLLQFSEYVYHCLPYLEIKNGLGFKKVPKESGDNRYAAVWIRAEQAPDAVFAALPLDRQASAMFSRYAVPMIKRLAAMPGFASDPDVHGFSVAVEWIKPGSDPNRPTMEILSMFADQASTRGFLGKTLPAKEYVEKMRLTFFDGDKEVGRLPIEVWEDNFVGTYKVPGYEMEKGKVCS
ncbi:MAG: hypothetical protein Q7W02_17135 [Candidatus Rokubacteria bacterium]|nr:hypothetical protein [Candidatus Rokubacteria bacterium]